MTLAAVLQKQAKAVVGRDHELARLRDEAAPITWVHGIAGCGKTALLRAFADEDVAWIDCRSVEPTERGFHGLPLLDMWLRMTFLPQLPAGARVVISSREPPMAAWAADFGPLLRTMALGPLAPAAAEEVLRRNGVSPDRAAALNRFAHGHPLSLILAAGAPALPAVVDTLAGLYLDGLDAATRRALD